MPLSTPSPTSFGGTLAPPLDARREDRQRVDFQVEAYRINEANEIVGDVMQMTVRDVSEAGLGLLGPHNIAEDQLLLRWPEPTQTKQETKAVQIVWEEKRSTEEYYRFGAEYLADVVLSWPEVGSAEK